MEHVLKPHCFYWKSLGIFFQIGRIFQNRAELASRITSNCIFIMTYFKYVNKLKWQVISDDAVLPALCLFSPLSWYWLFQLSVLRTTITASLCHQKGHRLQVVCAQILLPNKHKVSRGNTNNDIICEHQHWFPEQQPVTHNIQVCSFLLLHLCFSARSFLHI